MGGDDQKKAKQAVKANPYLSHALGQLTNKKLFDSLGQRLNERAEYRRSVSKK